MEINELAQRLIVRGYQKRASDLYIFPDKVDYCITYRSHQNKWIDSRLSFVEGENLILYFKYSAEMDIAERRKIQVGAMTYLLGNQEKRLRLSSVADYRNRESLVVRFLQDFQEQDHLLYYFEHQLKEIEQQVKRRGLTLFCGPTGSGKTTTMYYLAKMLAEKNLQVITIEDPVEIAEANFLQLQTNPKIQLDYEKLIKVCLRHRPDILIVGEIRDQETAQIVIRGALTGHTIFSTVHTGRKEEVIPRLRELGVSASDLDQALKGIVFQRLLPKKCLLCLGECTIYCQQIQKTGNYGVLFDSIFLGDEQNVWKENHYSWQKNLRKAWACDFISDQTYAAEKSN